MEHSWRHGPIQGEICPRCSISHFPFCSMHLTRDRIPCFVAESDHPFYRPNFVPRGHPRLHCPNSIEYVEPRYWARNANVDWGPYGGLQDKSSIMPNGADDFASYNHAGDGYMTSDYRNNKRMRVCDTNPGVFTSGYHQKSEWSPEDSHRLKLIRDHGIGVYPPLQVNPNPGLIRDHGIGVYSPLQVNPNPGSFHPRLGLNENICDGNVVESEKICDSVDGMNFRAREPLINDNSSVNQGFSSTESGRSFVQQSMHRHGFDNPLKRNQEPNEYLNFPRIPHCAPPNLNRKNVYSLIHNETDIDNGMSSDRSNKMQDAGSHGVLPPFHTSQQLPLPLVPAAHASTGTKPSSSPLNVPYLPFPILHTAAPSSSAYPALHAGFFVHPASQYKSNCPDYSKFIDEPKVVDASKLLILPFRATRLDHIVIILRGLPGSGKSYLAKMLRDLEVENGGKAPRIHSMDEYFMTEVEKVEESGTSKPSSSARGRNPVMKKVLEYCYEPEMEEAYRSSMLKAFKKTLEEGNFTFVIVDDRNLRVADFAQFWAVAKGLGYEVYLLEATYRDPTGCAARNVHGFTLEDIQKMATHWEEAPSMYWQLDIKSLFHGDDFKASRIQEVDMDVDDEDINEGVPLPVDKTPEKIVLHSVDDSAPHDSSGGRECEQETDVKELGRSKWLDDVEEDETEKNESVTGGDVNALCGLIHTYTKEGKTVCWGDQVSSSSGFCIGAAKKPSSSSLSLVIGAGAGYNGSSNPLLPEEEGRTTVSKEKHDVFQERLRAEQESFKAIFASKRTLI